MSPMRRAPALAAAAVILSSCVTPSPRAYTPVIAPPPADPAAFQRDFSACASEVEANPDNFSANRGEDVETAMQMGELAIIFLPLALLMPGGVNQRINEKSVMNSMKLCLSKRGYTVSDWKLVEAEVASGQLVTPMEFKRKWRAWLLPGASTQPTEIKLPFNSLQQCQVGGLEALRTMGATAGGYGCVSDCRWDEGNKMTTCQAWMSDKRAGLIFDAVMLSADAASHPGWRLPRKWSARARGEADKTGPAAPLPSSPPRGEGPSERPSSWKYIW